MDDCFFARKGGEIYCWLLDASGVHLRLTGYSLSRTPDALSAEGHKALIA